MAVLLHLRDRESHPMVPSPLAPLVQLPLQKLASSPGFSSLPPHSTEWQGKVVLAILGHDECEKILPVVDANAFHRIAVAAALSSSCLRAASLLPSDVEAR